MQLSPTALILADRGQRRLVDTARLDTAAGEPTRPARTAPAVRRRRWRLAILRPRPA